MAAGRSASPFLHFLPDQHLDGGPVQLLPSRLADLPVQYPAPQGVFHLVVSKDHELKRVFLSVRAFLRMVLDPHRRAWEPEVLDDLGGNLLSSVDDGRAGVIRKLRADYNSGILVLLGKVEADAALRADSSYAPVWVDVVGGQVHRYSRCQPAPSFRHIAVISASQQPGNSGASRYHLVPAAPTATCGGIDPRDLALGRSVLDRTRFFHGRVFEQASICLRGYGPTSLRGAVDVVGVDSATTH